MCIMEEKNSKEDRPKNEGEDVTVSPEATPKSTRAAVAALARGLR